MYDKFKERKPYALLDTSKYPPEVVGRFNSFITTQFDDSLSVEMQMRSIIKWAIDNFKTMDKTYNDFTEHIISGSINPFIEFLNDLIEYMNEFIDTFDGRYQETILNKMQEWYDNGELEELINDSLDTKYHEMDNRLTTQLAQTLKVTGQGDFTKQLALLAYSNRILSVGCLDKDKQIYSVVFDTGNGRGVEYRTDKSSVYDYTLFKEGRVGSLRTNHFKNKQENYTRRNGEFNESPRNHFTTEVGATVEFEFDGSGVDFNHYQDNRGGIWEFTVEGTSENKTISTYNPTSGVVRKELFRWDDKKQRTVIGTFKGTDPNNAPSGGTARGWLYVGSESDPFRTFNVYQPIRVIDPEVIPLYGTSNKEFAINMRESGTNHPYHFTPDHNGVATSTNIHPLRTYIDGEEVAMEVGDYIADVNEFKIVQSFYGKNPETPGNLARVDSVHTFRNGEVTTTIKVEFLEDVDIQQGYGIMFPISNQFSDKIFTSLGNEYETNLQDGSQTYLTDEEDLNTSFVALSDTYKNIAVACTIHKPSESLRWGREGKNPNRSLRTWIQNRDSEMIKIYPEVFRNTTVLKGEAYKVSGTFRISEGVNLVDKI